MRIQINPTDTRGELFLSRIHGTKESDRRERAGVWLSGLLWRVNSNLLLLVFFFLAPYLNLSGG